MKKLPVVLIAMLFSATMFISIGEARRGRLGQANPCVKDCKTTFSACMKEAKKMQKGTERKAQVKNCAKTFRECRKACRPANSPKAARHRRPAAN